MRGSCAGAGQDSQLNVCGQRDARARSRRLKSSDIHVRHTSPSKRPNTKGQRPVHQSKILGSHPCGPVPIATGCFLLSCSLLGLPLDLRRDHPTCRTGSCAGWGSKRRGVGGCLAAAWHYASLGFAEHPLRTHREWTGSVVPYNTLEPRGSRAGTRSNGEAFDEEAPVCSGTIPAKRRLFPGCGAPAPEETARTYAFLPLHHGA